MNSVDVCRFHAGIAVSISLRMSNSRFKYERLAIKPNYYKNNRKKKSVILWFGCMMFNAVFNYISVMSWRSVLLVEETRVPGENHRPVASH